MAVPASGRCPACGSSFAVGLAPAPPTQWFSCPHCRAPVPVLLPRDPPPLYTWEVLPHLYPTLPNPRIPRRSPRRTGYLALVFVAALAAVLAGTFGYYGAVAGAPGRFDISGTVERANSPFAGGAGITVVASPESGPNVSTVTGASGAYAFTGLPAGAVVLNVSCPGYSPVLVQVFVSSLYSAGASGIRIVLSPGSPGNVSSISFTPFPSLEGFVAAIGGGVALLGLVAFVAGVAAWATVRWDRPALGVVGGGAGLSAPLALLTLSLGAPFPLLVTATALLSGLGAFALVLRASDLSLVTPPLP